MTYLYNLYKPYLTRFFNREDGQGMAEYGLILALVALAGIVGLKLLGPAISQMFTDVANEL